MNTSVSRFFGLVVIAAIVGCKGKEPPKVPLGSAPPQTAVATQQVDPIGGEARVALDSANVLFRVKAYDLALAQYQRAANLAPTQVAPLLGILMVADKTKNKALTDATLPRIKKLDPLMSDSAAAGSHSKLMQLHPRPAGPPST